MTAKPASRLSQYVFVLSTLAIWAVFLKAIFSDTGLVAMMADEDKLLGSIRLWALVATPMWVLIVWPRNGPSARRTQRLIAWIFLAWLCFPLASTMLFLLS